MAVRSIDLTNVPAWTNDVYIPLYADQHRYLLLYGGAGAGKSVFAAQKLTVRSLAESGHRILVLRKVARTLRDSCFAQLQDVIAQWDMTGLFRVNKSDMSITSPNGSQFIFAGLDDVEKLKSITGVTAIWIEEASEVTADDFKQIDMRLRGQTRHYKQIILTFNPISVHSWLKRRFFDLGNVGAAKIIKTTYQDNRWIDTEYIRVLEDLKQQDAVYYAVYALGEWGVVGNLIFTNWTVDPDLPTEPESYSSVSIGLDFGFNEPSAGVKIGRRDGDVCIFGEVYERKLTNPQLIARLRPFAGAVQIVADSAEPARIAEMRLAQLRARPTVKGAGSVKDGIDWLRRQRIRVHPDCTNTIAELQAYKYREDRDGRVLEEPVDFENHAMDAIRYAIEPWRTEKSLAFLK